MVEAEYGRIGAAGRRLRYVAGHETGARKLVHKTLRRLATAKKRIGVPYRFRELVGPWQWLLLKAEESTTPALRVRG
jgi:hypothetical protein